MVADNKGRILKRPGLGVRLTNKKLAIFLEKSVFSLHNICYVN